MKTKSVRILLSIIASFSYLITTFTPVYVTRNIILGYTLSIYTILNVVGIILIFLGLAGSFISIFLHDKQQLFMLVSIGSSLAVIYPLYAISSFSGWNIGLGFYTLLNGAFLAFLNGIIPQEQRITVLCLACNKEVDSKSDFCDFCGEKLTIDSSIDP